MDHLKLKLRDANGDAGSLESRVETKGGAVPNTFTRLVGRGLAGLVAVAVVAGLHLGTFASAHPPRGCAGWGDLMLIPLDWFGIAAWGLLSSALVALVPVRAWMAGILAGFLTVGLSLPVHAELCHNPRCGWTPAGRLLPDTRPVLRLFLGSGEASTEAR